MSGALTLAAAFIIYSIYKYYKESQEEKEAEENRYFEELMSEKSETKENNELSLTSGDMDTRDLALRTLHSIGSEPIETEEGRIEFEYQGIRFIMEAVNDCAFVNLIWPWFHSFSKFDIDEFARVRQVVNDVNLRDTVSVVYTIADSDEVALHIKKNFIFLPQLPQIDEYLKLNLNSFFRTARTLDLEIEKHRMQECEKQV